LPLAGGAVERVALGSRLEGVPERRLDGLASEALEGDDGRSPH
jgi:hypothetical protein